MLRILLVTDSEALPRSAIGLGLEDTYLYRLERAASLWVLSWGGCWIGDITDRALNVASYLPPATFDLSIIQLGIVDCSPRPVPYFCRHQVDRLPGSIKKLVIKGLHYLRSTILKVGYTQYTPIDEFTLHYARLVAGLAEKSRNVVAIGIASVNELVARQSPQLVEQIAIYNAEIRKIAPSFIDLAGLEEDTLTDDAHINALGHDYIWQCLVPVLQSIVTIEV